MAKSNRNRKPKSRKSRPSPKAGSVRQQAAIKTELSPFNRDYVETLPATVVNPVMSRQVDSMNPNHGGSSSSRNAAKSKDPMRGHHHMRAHLGHRPNALRGMTVVSAKQQSGFWGAAVMFFAVALLSLSAVIGWNFRSVIKDMVASSMDSVHAVASPKSPEFAAQRAAPELPKPNAQKSSRPKSKGQRTSGTSSSDRR